MGLLAIILVYLAGNQQTNVVNRTAPIDMFTFLTFLTLSAWRSII